MYFRVTIIIVAMMLSSCSSWVYRIDIPQGNYIERKSIEKLQVGMTKEQVKFILGSHVVVDPFNDDTWSYVYTLKSGQEKRYDKKIQLIIKFVDDKVVSAISDYTLSENFNTPFNADTILESSTKKDNTVEEQDKTDNAIVEKAL